MKNFGKLSKRGWCACICKHIFYLFVIKDRIWGAYPNLDLKTPLPYKLSKSPDVETIFFLSIS